MARMGSYGTANITANIFNDYDDLGSGHRQVVPIHLGRRIGGHTTQDDADSHPRTLSAFVDANHKLLSTLGIFTALTVFARALPIRIVGDLTSFFFLAATITLWFELQEQYPPKGTSQKLRLFELAVSYAVLCLVVAWVFVYWAFWRLILVGILFLILGLGATSLLQRYNVFNRLMGTKAGERSRLRHMLYFAVVAVILTATFLIANLLGIKVIPWLERIHSQLQQSSQ